MTALERRVGPSDQLTESGQFNIVISSASIPMPERQNPFQMTLGHSWKKKGLFCCLILTGLAFIHLDSFLSLPGNLRTRKLFIIEFTATLSGIFLIIFGLFKLNKPNYQNRRTFDV